MAAAAGQCRSMLDSGVYDASLARVYGEDALSAQRTRVHDLLTGFAERFPSLDTCALSLVSSPGRTELGGNHTDHNHGRVLAAAVHLDCLAAVAPSNDRLVTMYSTGYDPIVVDLADTSPREAERGTPHALVRGVADALHAAGAATPGFNATVHSTIPAGAGLSSSAAFGVLIARIFNHLGSDGGENSDATTLQLARVARQAENVHFGKPCGFMDQMTSAFMGVVGIDFLDPEQPVVDPVEVDFADSRHTLCVVDTGGSHADLTPDYAAIREEMTGAAQALGVDAARGLTIREVMKNITRLRAAVNDRGILRLIHFIEEDRRAAGMVIALKQSDFNGFLGQVKASGYSSWRLLQNCYSVSSPLEQSVPLALTMSERLMGGRGACRIQGGGFAGTIQAYVPNELFGKYHAGMEAVFGAGAVTPLRVRQPDDGLIRPATDEGEA